MKFRLCIPFVIRFACTFAVAHGNYRHIMGTVTKISQDSVIVQTTAKVPVEVNLTPDTKFMKGNASAALKDVRVGDRVVIHAIPSTDGKLMAHTVQIGVTKALPQSH